MRVNCGTRILFLNGLVCTINLGIIYTICKSSSMVTDTDIDFVSDHATALAYGVYYARAVAWSLTKISILFPLIAPPVSSAV